MSKTRSIKGNMNAWIREISAGWLLGSVSILSGVFGLVIVSSYYEQLGIPLTSFVGSADYGHIGFTSFVQALIFVLKGVVVLFAAAYGMRLIAAGALMVSMRSLLGTERAAARLYSLKIKNSKLRCGTWEFEKIVSRMRLRLGRWSKWFGEETARPIDWFMENANLVLVALFVAFYLSFLLKIELRAAVVPYYACVALHESDDPKRPLGDRESSCEKELNTDATPSKDSKRGIYKWFEVLRSSMAGSYVKWDRRFDKKLDKKWWAPDWFGEFGQDDIACIYVDGRSDVSKVFPLGNTTTYIMFYGTDGAQALKRDDILSIRKAGAGGECLPRELMSLPDSHQRVNINANYPGSGPSVMLRHSIFFEEDRSDLEDVEHSWQSQFFKSIAPALKACNPDSGSLLIVGYASSSGKEARNPTLALQRAEFVFGRLKEQGLNVEIKVSIGRPSVSVPRDLLPPPEKVNEYSALGGFLDRYKGVLGGLPLYSMQAGELNRRADIIFTDIGCSPKAESGIDADGIAEADRAR